MVRATLTITSISLILAGCSTYSPDSKVAKEFATQKDTVCCFVGMKNLPDENAVRAAQYPDLSGQLADAKKNLATRERENADLARQLAEAKAAQNPDLSGQLADAKKNLATRESENADLARQLAEAKAAQNPDLSGQLADAKRNLATRERENADLARQLAESKAAQNPDLSGQLADAKKNLAAKESENADLARQNAAMREARDKKASDLSKALAEKGFATLHGIFFDFDKSAIKAESEDALLAVQQVLNNDPSLKLEIQGYTDSVGSTDYNDKLSHRRADAVKSYVIEHYGIAAERLSATGFGETLPADDNNTSVGRAHNRRVILIKK